MWVLTPFPIGTGSNKPLLFSLWVTITLCYNCALRAGALWQARAHPASSEDPCHAMAAEMLSRVFAGSLV